MPIRLGSLLLDKIYLGDIKKPQSVGDLTFELSFVDELLKQETNHDFVFYYYLLPPTENPTPLAITLPNTSISSKSPSSV